MAIIIKKGNILHIQWYDPITKKNYSKSTKLAATKSNWRKAESIAKKFQEALTERNQAKKKFGIESITIKEAFKHFLQNNEQKQPKTILIGFRASLPFRQHLNKVARKQFRTGSDIIREATATYIFNVSRLEELGIEPPGNVPEDVWDVASIYQKRKRNKPEK